MCNTDGISYELCYICAFEYILMGDYLFIKYVVVKRNKNIIKYICILAKVKKRINRLRIYLYFSFYEMKMIGTKTTNDSNINK